MKSFLLSSLALLLSPVFSEVASEPGGVRPVAKGDAAPNPSLRTVDGATVDLDTVRNGDPTVLVFYRGGWCPYCTRHLSALREVLPRIKEAGWKLVAVSPDTPEHLAETAKQHELDYTLVSDSTLAAAKAFGLAFQVDAATLKKYEKYNIDLVAASGESHRQLPVPAVILIAPDGTVSFVHHDPDYRKRLKPGDLVGAL